ncbi:hypothetical protein Y032_0051g2081 [Ancylostoma ceylanicum]|uniref:Uncharacterized protein n=1 Tax=Ancylostoma ceylanicum TaxID=53326 RepID=A0A016U8F5_9BILA|nr:hypothetical protein Y032_0051g2081 [Ancylostoma ceylanicum]
MRNRKIASFVLQWPEESTNRIRRRSCSRSSSSSLSVRGWHCSNVGSCARRVIVLHEAPADLALRGIGFGELVNWSYSHDQLRPSPTPER